MNPGRAGIWRHDAGRTKDRQPADDAETPVQRTLCDPGAVGNGDLDHDIARAVQPCRRKLQRGADHRAGGRIDRGLAGRKRQAQPGDRADALAGFEDHSLARCGPTQGRDHQRAVGDVGIVAGILGHARARTIGTEVFQRKRELRSLAPGKQDLDGIGKHAGQQRLVGGPRRRRGAGARRPAAAQLAGRLIHLRRRCNSDLIASLYAAPALQQPGAIVYGTRM
jgi:hypothetical protein